MQINPKILCLLICLGSTKLRAQTAPPNFGPDPSVSAAGSTNIQNSLFDGTANVNIPIFSATINNLTIPISISYNTKGIKVDDEASNVGIGWNLNTGGRIQRIVKDVPDEAISGYNFAGWNDQGRPGFWSGSAATNIDLEPDEFIVSLPSMHFKFTSSSAGAIIPIPYNDKIKISRLYTPNFPSGDFELQFQIIDEQGNEYYFTKGDYQTVTSGSNHYYAITDWVLSTVSAYTGQQIHFIYNYNAVNLPEAKHQSTLDAPPGQTDFWLDNIQNFNGIVSSIKEIDYPDNTKVYFNYDATSRCDAPGLYALNSIKIENKIAGTNYDNFLTYAFNYSYFTALNYVQSMAYNNSCNSVTASGTTYSLTPTMLRLRLDNISQVSSTGTAMPYYTFTYKAGLPARFSPMQDYYGYFNNHNCTPYMDGSTPHYLSEPYHENQKGNYFGLDKTSDEPSAECGLLTSMKNANSGEIDFTYSDYVTVAGLTPANYAIYGYATDGVVLHKTVEKDGYNADNTVTTTYTYWHYGSTNVVEEQFMPDCDMTYSFTDNISGAPYTYKAWFSSFLNSYGVNGSNHGFGYVEVVKQNAQGNQINRTVNIFSNVNSNPSSFVTPDGTGNNIINPPNTNHLSDFWKTYDTPPYSNKQYLREWAIGLPLEKISYDINDHITEDITYKYNISADMYFPSILCSKKLASQQTGSTINSYYIDNYYPVTGNISLSDITTTKYLTDPDISNPVVNSNNTHLTYDSHNNLKSEVSFNSKGEKIEKITYYPYEISPSYPGAVELSNLTSSKLYFPIYHEVWKYNSAGTSKRLVNASGVSEDVSYGGYPIPFRQYSLTAATSISTSTYPGGPSSFDATSAAANNPVNNFHVTSSITEVDKQDNPIETKTNAGTYNANFYDETYNRLIATVSNAHYNEVAYTSFEDAFSATGVADPNKGNWDFYNCSIVDVNTLSSGSTQTITGRNVCIMSEGGGSVESTIYPAVKKYILSFWAQMGSPMALLGSSSISLNAIETIRGGWTLYQGIFNGDGTSIVSVSGPSGMAIDELRLCPYSSQMKTYTYEPLFGVSSSCTENNEITTYIYDDWGNHTLTIDHLGNVIAKNKYTIQGND